MTRVELHNLLRQYADAQASADNADGDAEWEPLSDAAGAIAIALINAFAALAEKADRFDEVMCRMDQARSGYTGLACCPNVLETGGHFNWCPLRPMTWEKE